MFTQFPIIMQMDIGGGNSPRGTIKNLKAIQGRYEKLKSVALCIICIIGCISMIGCGEDEVVIEEVKLATYNSVDPPEGTQIAVDGVLNITFDNPPEGVKVSAGAAIAIDNTLRISGGFDPGSLKLEITWENALMGKVKKSSPIPSSHRILRKRC